MKRVVKWLFSSSLGEDDFLQPADGIARDAVWGAVIWLIILLLLLAGCATGRYYVVDCNAFPSAGEKAACEKGKTDAARELQAAREYSAYQQGRGGYSYTDYYGYHAGYWPILNVGVKTWSGSPYHYRDNYNYGCNGFMRYTPHCN